MPIKDKCLVCESSHVDLSLPAFTMLDSRVKARLEGAVYEIVECDGNTTLFPASISVWPRLVAGLWRSMRVDERMEMEDDGDEGCVWAMGL